MEKKRKRPVRRLVPLALLVSGPVLASCLPAASDERAATPAPVDQPRDRGGVEGSPMPPAMAAPSDETRPLASASRVEVRLFWSDALRRTMPYAVFLPPAFEAVAERRYPVLYMLHGKGASYNQWQAYGLLAAAERLIAAAVIPPLVIVLPQGDSAYWLDHAEGGPRWGTYIARDLVAEIDARFRTVPDREHRAIGGLSMGAHGALQLALNHLGVFGVVGAHTPPLRRHEEAPAFFGDATYFAAHDPVQLCRARPGTARTLKIWIDIGDEDQWRPAAEAFHAELTGLQIAHTWHVWPGGHSGAYWGAHVADYLRFYGAALAGGAR